MPPYSILDRGYNASALTLTLSPDLSRSETPSSLLITDR